MSTWVQSGTKFRDLPGPARLWLLSIAAIYVGMAVWAVPHVRLITLVALIPVFALAGLVKPGPHPSAGIRDSISIMIIIAALIWMPSEVVLGVGIGSFIGGRLFRRTEQWKTDANATSWGISAGIAATLARSLMSILPQVVLQILGGALTAVFANFVTNRLIFAAVRSYRFRRPFRHELRQGLSFGWPHEVLDLPLIVAIVAVARGVSDLAWSLAITVAAMLLLPLSQWVYGRYLEFIMQRRASAFLTNSQPATSAIGDSASGVARMPRLKRCGLGLILQFLEDRRDSTEPVRQVLGLESSGGSLFGTLQHIPGGISLINAEGTIVYANPSASRILGYRNSEHVGRSWFELCHPEDVGRVKSLFASLVREPGGHFTIEARMLHKDGSWKWVQANQANLFMQPSIRAIVVTYHDITQGRRSEETLEEYAARLEDLSRRLFLAQETERRRIAKELHDETGQILTGLKLTLDAAIADIGESQDKGMLPRMKGMVETLQEQLRALSLNLRPVALDDLGLLPAILMLCTQYDTYMSVRVKTSHSGINGCRFASEIETTAYRIVQEGLTNVARHARVPEATVRLWADGEILGIQVEDCGKGFVAESAELIADSSGLSGMRERVLLVGGEFSIESTPGKGTRLTAELPLHRQAIGAPVAKG